MDNLLKTVSCSLFVSRVRDKQDETVREATRTDRQTDRQTEEHESRSDRLHEVEAYVPFTCRCWTYVADKDMCYQSCWSMGLSLAILMNRVMMTRASALMLRHVSNGRRLD